MRKPVEELISSAVDALAANRLRTILTVAVIAVGITSIVGIETALEILSGELGTSFTPEGGNTFAIVSSSEEGCRAIEWREGELFASHYKGGKVNLRSELTPAGSVSYGGRETDPVVSLTATDENWLEANGCTLSTGRNFTHFEAATASGVCLIGDGVRRKLFEAKDPLGCVIKAGGRMLTVVGCISRQGSVMGGGADQSVAFPGCEGSAKCLISIIPDSAAPVESALEQARLLMRSIRRINSAMDDDFLISTSDATASRVGSIQKKLSLAALAIGLVTLIGAAISLMNVMLVGVKERFREIGLRKALGESRASIRRQFLAEAVIIGQIGAFVGIILGLLAGNVVALSLESDPVIPWAWILRASLICIVVSLAAGTMPATKAASLAPVDALRDD